jgi:hypothetical protein
LISGSLSIAGFSHIVMCSGKIFSGHQPLLPDSQRLPFHQVRSGAMSRDRILCVMAPTQSSNSSFSWSTLKEARKRLFFCARRKLANDIQQM